MVRQGAVGSGLVRLGNKSEVRYGNMGCNKMGHVMAGFDLVRKLRQEEIM